MKKRIKSATMLVTINLAVNAAIALIFSVLNKGDSTVLDTFPFIFEYLFWLFGGGLIIAAFIMIAFNMTDDAAFKYGYGFYYGTAFCAVVLFEYLNLMEAEPAIFVSAIITGLVCYIIRIKNKEQNK